MSSVLNQKPSSILNQNSSKACLAGEPFGSIADCLKNSNSSSHSNVFYENIYDIKRLENIKPDKIFLDQIKYSKLVEILVYEIKAIPEYCNYKNDIFSILLLVQKSQILVGDDKDIDEKHALSVT